ncbi:MAG: riboflavin biosynthesis protein RibF [Muribaculaceae bacterium]|nr:riboflavin biosynthesis protein RibF [Muribaculaceae bacterium]
MSQLINSDTFLPAGSTVATIGVFDGVHLGHATLVGKLREYAQEHRLKSLVITFGQHPQQVLAPERDLQLIQPLAERIEALNALQPDGVLVLDFTPQLAALDSRTFMQLLRDRYGVRALIAGYNHRFGHDSNATFESYREIGHDLGIDVVKAPEYLGEYAPVSSTIIRGLIRAGKVDDAMRCLTRPYRLAGKVVHGFHNGRGIGFPTANVGYLDPTQILPHNGAYAVMVTVAGRRLQGMVNVGNRPTFNNGEAISIEVNIFDFDDDIYGQPIALEFIKFLRLEFKLGSIEQLREQLTRDRDKSRKILQDFT